MGLGIEEKRRLMAKEKSPTMGLLTVEAEAAEVEAAEAEEGIQL